VESDIQGQILQAQQQVNEGLQNLAITMNPAATLRQQQQLKTDSTEGEHLELDQNARQKNKQTQNLDMMPFDTVKGNAIFLNPQKQISLLETKAGIQQQKNSFDDVRNTGPSQQQIQGYHMAPMQDLTVDIQNNQTKASTKRPAPSTEPSYLPLAKKFAMIQTNQQTEGKFQETLQQPLDKNKCTITQCSAKDSPSLKDIKTQFQLQRESSQYSPQWNAAKGDGILGSNSKEGETDWDTKASSQIANSNQPRKGSTQCKQGTTTRRRQGKSINQHGKKQKDMTAQILHSSPVRSMASSGNPNTVDFDPWPLHTPSVSSSQETQDSLMEAFSPPKIIQDQHLWENENRYSVTIKQRRAQHELEANTVPLIGEAQTQADAIVENQVENNEAQALALKAPRAP
jgi:hypothetical protein